MKKKGREKKNKRYRVRRSKKIKKQKERRNRVEKANNVTEYKEIKQNPSQYTKIHTSSGSAHNTN